MLIVNVKWAVLVIIVTSQFSTTKNLSEGKITLWNVPTKSMREIDDVHSGSMSYYQLRNWSRDNLLCQEHYHHRHVWNSFVFLIWNHLNWNRLKKTSLCISTTRALHSNKYKKNTHWTHSRSHDWMWYLINPPKKTTLWPSKDWIFHLWYFCRSSFCKSRISSK